MLKKQCLLLKTMVHLIHLYENGQEIDVFSESDIQAVKESLRNNEFWG